MHAATPEAAGMNISLTASDIRINISPAIIELLNKAMTTLTGPGSKSSGDNQLEELPDHSQLWGVKQFKDDDFWFMKIGELLF